MLAPVSDPVESHARGDLIAQGRELLERVSKDPRLLNPEVGSVVPVCDIVGLPKTYTVDGVRLSTLLTDILATPVDEWKPWQCNVITRLHEMEESYEALVKALVDSIETNVKSGQLFAVGERDRAYLYLWLGLSDSAPMTDEALREIAGVTEVEAAAAVSRLKASMRNRELWLPVAPRIETIVRRQHISNAAYCKAIGAANEKGALRLGAFTLLRRYINKVSLCGKSADPFVFKEEDDISVWLGGQRLPPQLMKCAHGLWAARTGDFVKYRLRLSRSRLTYVDFRAQIKTLQERGLLTSVFEFVNHPVLGSSNCWRLLPYSNPPATPAETARSEPPASDTGVEPSTPTPDPALVNASDIALRRLALDERQLVMRLLESETPIPRLAEERVQWRRVQAVLGQWFRTETDGRMRAPLVFATTPSGGATACLDPSVRAAIQQACRMNQLLLTEATPSEKLTRSKGKPVKVAKDESTPPIHDRLVVLLHRNKSLTALELRVAIAAIAGHARTNGGVMDPYLMMGLASISHDEFMYAAAGLVDQGFLKRVGEGFVLE